MCITVWIYRIMTGCTGTPGMKAPKRNVISALLEGKEWSDVKHDWRKYLFVQVPSGKMSTCCQPFPSKLLSFIVSNVFFRESGSVRCTSSGWVYLAQRSSKITGKFLPDKAAKERNIFSLGFGNNTRGSHHSNGKRVKKSWMRSHTKDWSSLGGCLKIERWLKKDHWSITNTPVLQWCWQAKNHKRRT